MPPEKNNPLHHNTSDAVEVQKAIDNTNSQGDVDAKQDMVKFASQSADVVVIFEPVIPQEAQFKDQLEVDSLYGYDTPTERKIKE